MRRPSGATLCATAFGAAAILVASCRSSSALDGQTAPRPAKTSGGVGTPPPVRDHPASSAPPGPSASAPPTAPRPSTGAVPPRLLDDRVYEAADAAPPVPEPTSPAKRICTVAAIGDSLTDPRSHGGGYLEVLRERAPESRFDSYGKGGEMVNQMRRRFARDVLDEPPTPGKPRYTHVIVYGGVNDLYSDVTANRTLVKITSDLRTMYEGAHARSLRVVAINVSPWGGFSRYYNDKRAQTTRALNAWIAGQRGTGNVDVVVDSYGLLSCGDPERLCPELMAPFKDGIHFGPKGHQKLGEALYEAAFRDCR